MYKTVSHIRSLNMEIVPPGDKSIAHRAVMLNSLAEGTARITHFCGGADCLSTVRCMRALGAGIKRLQPSGAIEVSGAGKSGLREPGNILNAGNSGTTTRLLAGLLSGQHFLSVITGDSSLRSRPMGRVIKPLRLMGAGIDGRGGGLYVPLAIRGGGLHGIEYSLPEPSAQVKSAIILAGLFAEGETSIIEPAPTRDHTERMLRAMGAEVWRREQKITVSRLSGPLRPTDIVVPGDVSSAAFWLVAAAIHPSARITIKDCGVNPTRTGIIDILRAMGATIRIQSEKEAGGEPIADIIVETSRLRGVDLEGDIIVRAIDEIPVLAVAACFATGVTSIRSAGELRVKETDRIAQTARELRRMGALIEELPDGMIIKGVQRLKAANVESHGDHRLAMSLAIAGLMAKGNTVIKDAEAASVSYPEFWDELDKAANSNEGG